MTSLTLYSIAGFGWWKLAGMEHEQVKLGIHHLQPLPITFSTASEAVLSAFFSKFLALSTAVVHVGVVENGRPARAFPRSCVGRKAGRQNLIMALLNDMLILVVC